MFHKLISVSFCAASVASALYTPLTYAQQSDNTTDEVERIVVTSDFRQRTLDQLSASASIISATRLSSRQATHIDSVLAAAPNVNFASGASRGRFIQIRGIGERSQFSEPVNPSVSFLVDAFDFSGLAAAGLLFDTRQMEVFRGPQATLFGTGALAGAIKLNSYAPGQDGPDYIEGRVATQNSYRLEGAVGGAMSDDWDYRVAAMHNRSDGFVTNTFLNRDDTDNIDESAAKIAIAGALDARTRMEVNYRFYDIDNGYDAFSLENTYNTRSDEPGYDQHQTHAVSLKTVTTTQGGDLTVIATHASHNIAYGYDEDWTYTGFHPDGYSSFDAYFRDIDTQTAEIRFNSNDSAALFNGRTSWLVGALYKTSEEALQRQYTYAAQDFASTYEPDTSAAYLQTDTRLTDDLSLVLGIRAENYAFDYTDNAGLQRKHDTNMFGGKAALQYQLGRHFWYASVSRGYKGAGFNPDERVSEQSRFFDEEYNWNYELGVKGPLTDTLTLRAAVFYMDRTDTQVSDYDVLLRDNGSAEFIDIIDNADRGTNQGAEVEFSWQLLDNWSVKGSAGYLDATFEGYTAADGTVVDEQRQAQAPEFTGNLFSEVLLHQNWLWRLTIDYKDEYRFSDGHDETSPATTLVNTEVVWMQQDWQTTLWVNNAFDKEYYVRGFGGFNNDPREGYFPSEPYYQLGDGRQVGVTVRYEF
ncbi:TonB-dependent receptor [Alteromonas halophila]|uniref:TonB-dependent receptor n=1 Tax=Alteromonas halophila TaxID=516698 RepID=A0A918MV46_9ALTE|nr:TonB-dependent receptor [Alteromonas halophila]GGW74127.1 TonB-dependent receptor [Alteromonas halophila]